MKRTIVLLAASAAALAAAPAASAQVSLDDGQTKLTLNKGTVAALTHLGVSVRPTGPATLDGRNARFPVVGGEIDPATAAGKFAHRGGLRLKAANIKVKLDNYIVKVGSKITLSARINGGKRATILNLTGTPKVTRDGFGTKVSGLTAKLNKTAARTLNKAYGVTAFKKGLKLGKVRTSLVPSDTELLPEGATSLALAPAALQAIVAQGITPGVIGPATLAGTTASFPITGGLVALDLSAAEVSHSGGISLTKGATVVRLTDFDIVVGGSGAPQLFATLNGGATPVAIIDLDLSALTPAIDGRNVTLSGITAKLTQGAADALNAAFGTTAFAGGLVLGQATVNAVGK
ncbi:MAG: hypothetical protein ABW060_00905 [Solirubrobacteraceae bacterium]